jgi:hypothetical protein
MDENPGAQVAADTLRLVPYCAGLSRRPLSSQNESHSVKPSQGASRGTSRDENQGRERGGLKTLVKPGQGPSVVRDNLKTWQK